MRDSYLLARIWIPHFGGRVRIVDVHRFSPWLLPHSLRNSNLLQIILHRLHLERRALDPLIWPRLNFFVIERVHWLLPVFLIRCSSWFICSCDSIVIFLELSTTFLEVQLFRKNIFEKSLFFKWRISVGPVWAFFEKISWQHSIQTLT